MIYLLRMFMVLVVLAGGLSGPARADTSIDPEEALKLLDEKKEHEEAELKRLAAMVQIPAGEFVMGRAGDGLCENPPASAPLLESTPRRREKYCQSAYNAFGQ